MTALNPAAIIAQIDALGSHWHASGSLSREVLVAIADLAPPIRHSIETGAGKSTLLLSHLSPHHLVFALDRGNSLSQVRQSPLLRGDRVEIIEGPTQITLPSHALPDMLDFALIDGPHAFPFAELEYFHIYPRLAEGALLVVDDIDIPTLRNLAAFLRQDDMFETLATVRTTAFFRRTGAPTFDPHGDGWGQQGYNRQHKQRLNRLRALRQRVAVPWLANLARPLLHRLLRRM